MVLVYEKHPRRAKAGARGRGVSQGTVGIGGLSEAPKVESVGCGDMTLTGEYTHEEMKILDADAETMRPVRCDRCNIVITAHRLRQHQEGKACLMQTEANAARARGLAPVREGWISKYLREAGIPMETHGLPTFVEAGVVLHPAKRIQDGVRRGPWAPAWAIDIVRRCRYRPTHGEISKQQILRFLREAQGDLEATLTVVCCITRRGDE